VTGGIRASWVIRVSWVKTVKQERVATICTVCPMHRMHSAWHGGMVDWCYLTGVLRQCPNNLELVKTEHAEDRHIPVCHSIVRTFRLVLPTRRPTRSGGGEVSAACSGPSCKQRDEQANTPFSRDINRVKGSPAVHPNPHVVQKLDPRRTGAGQLRHGCARVHRPQGYPGGRTHQRSTHCPGPRYRQTQTVVRFVPNCPWYVTD
jgi:hypothetical protein